MANYEALWNFRAVKFYGVALREGVVRSELATGPVGPLGKELEDYGKWELLNMTISQMIGLRREVALAVRNQDPAAFARLRRAVRLERIETLGIAEFFTRHPDLRPPRVLVASSAHYSWEKGMKVLGLGTAQLVKVAVDDHMRLDPDHLEECLAEARASLAAAEQEVQKLRRGGADVKRMQADLHQALALADEVGPEVALTKHAITVRPLFISNKTFQRLPKGLQDCIVTAGAEAGKFGRELESSQDSEKLKAMQDKGWLTTHEFADRDKMLELANPVLEAYAEELGALEVLRAVQAVQ